MVPMSQILAERKLTDHFVSFQATEDWGQGRTCFGGFLSALALVAMRDSFSIDTPLRALQTNFVGPVPPGEVICKSRLLRQGKNVTQIQCEIFSDEVVCGSVIGVFGASRATQLPSMSMPYARPAKSADECDLLPFIDGVTPQFLQHIHMKWAEGHFPYTNQGDWNSKIYLRTPDEAISPEVQIVMLSDGPPTPALSFFNGPTMASSVSWALELPPLPLDQINEGWFQIDMQVIGAAEGYTNLRSTLWTPSGQLASLGSQVVAVFG